ncbi:cyclase family protein [Candidatus Uhrbacteria bacterium]|nr:cyclase family protein [Candidatus Uhrbacteria bacterium]
MKIIDISLPIFEGMITYPGNPEVKITQRKGASSIHSEIAFGSHTGTHIDAPAHVSPKAKPLSRLPLSVFVGPARVLDFSNVKEAITVADLNPYHIKKGERILVKTSNSTRGFKNFYSDYVYLDGEAADFLARRGIALFGIDALSVKKRGGSDLRPHTSLLKRNIPILEGLQLKGVRAGSYQLVCLPLSFQAIDGSPARAVLIS